MRVKVDQNLPREVADLLRARGHDAMTVEEQGLSGMADGDLGAVLQAEKRGIMTLDVDFGDVRSYPPESHSGLIVLRLERQDKPYVLGIVGRLVDLLDSQDPSGHLWIVDETRVRVRP